MDNPNNRDYETIARSNESIRDVMDGHLSEPQKPQSTESQKNDNSQSFD